jgi:hypothetical protein
MKRRYINWHHTWTRKENTMKIDALEALQLTTSAWDVSGTTFTTVLIKQVSTVGLHIRCIGGHS